MLQITAIPEREGGERLILATPIRMVVIVEMYRKHIGSHILNKHKHGYINTVSRETRPTGSQSWVCVTKKITVLNCNLCVIAFI